MPFFTPAIIDGGFAWSHSGFRDVVSVCFVLVIIILSWCYLHRSSPGRAELEPDDKSSNTRECRDGPSAEGTAAVVERDGLSTDRGNSSGKNLPPKAQLGLQILHDCDEPKMDIVAVHGLGANPDYAWVWLPKNNPTDSYGYPNEPFNWLQKLLPAKIPCRVLAFNYDSTWISDAPQQRLSNISDSLLDTLRDDRDKTPAVSRPLIFIGHSFGGNVIKQAIVSASRTSSEYLSIAESTVGVVFLGTPHRGSPAAAWGALITSLAPPGFIIEDRLLKALEEHSDSLTDRLQDFSHWVFSQSVPVVCAFEQLVTDYSSRAGVVGKLLSAKQLVVPESSACIDGHHKISLHTDHLKINKFYGAEDPSFKLIYPQILRMVERAEQTLNRRRNPKAIPTDESSTSDNLKKALQKMNVRNPLDILFDIQMQKGERVGHTCEWILKRDEFSIWSISEEPQFLRLIGSPGIGKTMMSTFLVRELRTKVEKSPSKAFAYFFCDDKDQKRKTPTAILLSLTWQLLLQRNELFQHMQPDFEKHTDDRVFDDLFCDFSALWRIFKHMLQDESAGEIFILIDALDECESSTRRNFLLSIKELFKSSSAGRSGKIKLVITCRPQISDIEYVLQGVGVPLEMGSADINNDLAEYIDDKVGDLASRKQYTLKLKQNVSDTLKREAGSTFLWVSLMVAELQAVLMHQVEERLKSLPHGLDETYTRILQQIPPDKQKTAQFILHCMVAARRPLEKTEIQTAYATWTTGSIHYSEDLEVYEDILSVCSSILYVRNGTLNFCHQSVKDFLPCKPSTIDAWYHTAEDEANAVLFRACWVYLSAEEFNHGNLIVSGEEGFLQTGDWKRRKHLSQHLFLEYSSGEWENHAIASHRALLLDLQALALDIAKAPTLRDTWLIRTAQEGQDAVVQLLLDNGADIEAKDLGSQTPLSWAAWKGREAVVQLLLEKRANIEAKDQDGQAPLSRAAGNGHKAVVQLLLDKGADIEAKDKYGRTPLSWATGNRGEAVMWLEKDLNIVARDKYDRTPLSLAAENRHRAVVRLLLKRDPDIEAKDQDSRTPPPWAAGKRHGAVVRRLPKKSSGIEAKDQNSQTPLPWATGEAVVQLLLDKGADIEAKDKYGRTPLSWAAENRHEAVVQLLLESGADIEVKDLGGQTPLSWAAESGHESVVRLLLQKRANIEARDKYGQTPLFWAAGNRHESDRTKLSLATRNRREVVARLLLDKGADIEAKDQDGQTLLSQAARNGHEAVVRLLLEKSADIETKDQYGQTPLWWAALEGHKAVVRLLLTKQNIESRSKDSVFSLTPLSCAAMKGTSPNCGTSTRKGQYYHDHV